MRYLCALALSLVASGWNAAAQIPAGSRFLLRVQNAVSSRTAQPGDSIYMVTVTPLAAAGRIVIPAGSQVRGEVTQVRKSAPFHRRAELAIELRTVTLMSGMSAPLAGRIVALDGTRAEPRPAAAEMDRVVWSSAGSPLAIGGITGVLSQSGEGFRIGTAAGLGVRLLLVAFGSGRSIEIRPGSQMEAVIEAPLAFAK
ncbi:MAG TPA: hypothetical protein VHC72_03260 [Bryobacteraceae bacterium]|nr:hypothetical protein [Bryobacteraceae bacterium]